MNRPPKKTETIEIRVPYETKLAFMAQCREEGVSASEALRTFIGDRLETQPAAERPSAPTPWRKRLKLVGGLAVAVGVAATAVPSLAGSVDRLGFGQLDLDGSGGVSRMELSRGARMQIRLQAGATGLEIGRATVTSATSPVPAEGGELFDALLRRRFTSLDADGDGSVNFSEFRRR